MSSGAPHLFKVKDEVLSEDDPEIIDVSDSDEFPNNECTYPGNLPYKCQPGSMPNQVSRKGTFQSNISEFIRRKEDTITTKFVNETSLHALRLHNALKLMKMRRMHCNLCTEMFVSKEELADHIKKVHSDDVLSEYLKLLIAQQQKDPVPSFRNKTSRKGHPSWRFFEKIDRYDAMCLLCSTRVRSACSTNLTRHLLRHHPQEGQHVQNVQKHHSQPRPISDIRRSPVTSIKSFPRNDTPLSELRQMEQLKKAIEQLPQFSATLLGAKICRSEKEKFCQLQSNTTTFSPQFRDFEEALAQKDNYLEDSHVRTHNSRAVVPEPKPSDSIASTSSVERSLDEKATTHQIKNPNSHNMLSPLKSAPLVSCKLSPRGSTIAMRESMRAGGDAESAGAERAKRGFQHSVMETSGDTAATSNAHLMHSGPHHPVAIRPTPVLSHLDFPLELQAAQWCHQFPTAYQDLRPVTTTQLPVTSLASVPHASYELDSIEQQASIYDLGVQFQKYDIPKYDAYAQSLNLAASNGYEAPKLFHDDSGVKQENQTHLQSVVVGRMASMIDFSSQAHTITSTDAQQQQLQQQQHHSIIDQLGQHHAQLQQPSVIETRKSCEPNGSKGDGATPAKRGRPTENPCWNYFIRLDDQNVRCRICSKIVKSACATNMTKHLERHHQNDYQHLIVQIKQYRQQKGPQPVLSLTPFSATVANQQVGCIVPNQSVKSETPFVDDIYSQQFGTDEALLRNYAQFEQNQVNWRRAATNSEIWSGQFDRNWTQGADPSTSVMSDGSWAQSPLGQLTDGQSGGDKPYLKRNRKTEHPVWEFFKRTLDGNAQCSICVGVVKSPCSSNFMRHLMRHHSAEYNAVYVKWVQKRGPGK